MAALGVGAALALVLFLEGLWAGILQQSSSFIDNSGADLFVADRGTETTVETSVVPLTALDRIRSTAGVDRADPVILRSAVLDLHGRRVVAAIVGSRPGALGGPWSVSSGRPPRRSGEVVVDDVLASQHDIRIGQRAVLYGRTFRVVGLSSGTRTWMSGYVFATHADLEALGGRHGSTSFILVRTQRPAAVARAIAGATGLDVVPAEQLAAADRKLFADILESILRLMILIALGAGTLVIALTGYSAVVEHTREYGIARAMGARAARLYRIVVGQAAILAVLGVVSGFVIYTVGTTLVRELRPQFWVRLGPRAVVETILAAAIMAVLASIFPTLRVARLDPASVYRSSS